VDRADQEARGKVWLTTVLFLTTFWSFVREFSSIVANAS
jgi:hypothetical protein